MSETAQANPPSPTKPTGSLKAPTGALDVKPVVAAELPRSRNFLLRAAELAVFLTAVVGAVALGLGITDYFQEHAYIGAYLLAYAGFRCADLLMRDEYGPDPTRDTLNQRMMSQMPLLVLFAAAPFERTYLYGGEPPKWIGAFALLVELLGLWVALGARIQLGFFSWETTGGIERRVLVRSGFYKFVRHPTYAGVFLALLAWPIAYGAPITFILMGVLGALVVRKNIAAEETELIERFGQDYLDYRERTDALIPNIW